ncbi:MAG: hypothetical protein HW406_67 [Candidatus Brocadiaceae bacterium]|nr:hypothetical protein [Candidatus Brocadiaceae bacterium]
MKIAIVCPDGLSIVLFCKGIIRVLKRIKDTEVFVLSKDGTYKSEIESLGVKSVTVDMYRFFNPLKDFQYFVTLYRIFKREKFDIVINFTTKPNIYGTFAAKMAHINKIISHVVGLGSISLPSDTLTGKLLRYVFLKLYCLSCKLSEKLWFTNRNDLNYFISQGITMQGKSVLTKNYLDTDEYSPTSVSEETLSTLRKELQLVEHNRIVVMVARLIWPKGIKEFVEAAQLLKDKYPYLKFLLVAPVESGGPNAVPESYVREKEKASNFKWLGFRSDVKSFYALSEVTVLPSYYKEGGYPRTLLEPMSMGKPIITTDSPDCREMVEDGKNGYLVPIKDSKLLAEAIEKLIIDENKRKAFGLYSRLKAEKEFDEKKIVSEALVKLGIINASC